MKTPAKFLFCLLIGAGIFFAGYLANRQGDPATSSASAEQSIKYICPMHPQYSSDRSDSCPICGMSLVPASPSGDSSPADPELPGTVRISAEKRQLVGVRTEEVKQRIQSHNMRVPGRIAVDESRLYRIVAATDGWIRKLESNPAGTFVTRHQVLASYYAANLAAAQQSLITSTSVNDRQQRADTGAASQRSTFLLQSAFDGIRSLGMDDMQIEELQRTRQYASEIWVYSPATGYVVSRNVSPEQRFDKGSELYRIADVSRVWVMADIFEKDREFLIPGATAIVHYRDHRFQARMSNALPQFDPESRTLKTRFEVENPRSILLPDMFVDVEVHVNRPAAITVPSDAVVDSGLRKTVYVEREAGIFEPRLVQTGWRLGNQMQITSGLKAGERIVVAGNFLIDSESRMKMPDSTASTAEQTETVKDLVCGMDVDPKSPKTFKTQYKGETYYFCAEMCKKKFEADPEKFVQKKQPAKPTVAKDLVCGMDVDPQSPDTLKTEYKGKTYYFCAETCKKSFEANPEKYVQKKGMAAGDMHGMHMAK